jgi:hypothetical protein
VKYLVDANILSELTKPTPDPRVMEWLRGHEPDIAVDPIILGELRFDSHPSWEVARSALERWSTLAGAFHRLAWDADTGLSGRNCWPPSNNRQDHATGDSLTRRRHCSTDWWLPRETALISRTLACKSSIRSLTDVSRGTDPATART